MFQYNANGFYWWAVVNEKDRVVDYSKSIQKNMILNQGLNGIAVRSWADSFISCAVGTGTSSPNVNQTGLDNELKRTSVYLDAFDANKAFLDSDLYTIRRTFVFSKEGGRVTYYEMGFGFSILGPNDLFSRIRLPGVTVSSGERLIVQYELQIKITPNSPVQKLNPIQGLKSSGVFAHQLVGLKGVDSLGSTCDFDSANSCNEPSSIANGFVCVDSSLPSPLGSSVSRTGVFFSKNTFSAQYVQNSFSLTKILLFENKEAMGFPLSCAGLGGLQNPHANTGLVYVFNPPFKKPQGDLSFSFVYSWASRTKENYSALYYWQPEEEMTLRKSNPLLLYFAQNNE